MSSPLYNEDQAQAAMQHGHADFLDRKGATVGVSHKMRDFVVRAKEEFQAIGDRGDMRYCDHLRQIPIQPVQLVYWDLSMLVCRPCAKAGLVPPIDPLKAMTCVLCEKVLALPQMTFNEVGFGVFALTFPICHMCVSREVKKKRRR